MDGTGALTGRSRTLIQINIAAQRYARGVNGARLVVDGSGGTVVVEVVSLEAGGTVIAARWYT